MPFISRYACWAVLVLIALLSLAPPQWRPHLIPIGQLEHLAAYALVGALLAARYRAYRPMIIVSIALPVCAALLEIAQIWTPGRDPKFSDFAAGALGTWIGVASVLFALRSRVWLRGQFISQAGHHPEIVAGAVER